MSVKVEDRKDEIEHLRLALNIAEMSVSYEGCDLILAVQKKLTKKKGNFNVKDGVHIRREWEMKWEAYHADLVAKSKEK